ncbi:hypothetical protein OV090_34125 [Nannocystis sp. RBIL2]|uniref:tetratricopeptide repeat protein n=1 Tax=Nannocystis sp. RBIL2 TaxID=2996788 RepID=UPI00226D46C1|nr:hypothetical protein [Nannocystis sp. RBIL2]MCY1069829.1 hypothetical protein [Nannocystis sp. RBIL2]
MRCGRATDRALALGLAAVLGLASGPARAGGEPFLVDRAARAHYDRAGRHAEKGDLRRAASELDAAYAIEPHPELLFIRAELRRQLDECEAAVSLYRQFIATSPSEAATQQARDGIAACTPAAPDPLPDPLPEFLPPPERPPWHRDPAGGVLLGFGVAGVVAATALAGAGGWTYQDATQHYLQSDYQQRRGQTIAMQWAAGGAALLGAALLVGAALRYRAVRQRERRLGAWLSGQGAGLVVGGRF